MNKSTFSDESLAKRILKAFPDDDEDRIFSWFRTPPKYTVIRINPLKTDLDQFLLKLESFLQQQYEEKKKTRPSIIIPTELGDTVVLKSSGLDEAVKPLEAPVIVDHFCGLAVLRGADVFAPGVLGAHANLKVGSRVSVYADVKKHCLRGSTKGFMLDQCVFVGNGKANMSRVDIFKSDKPCSGIAIKMTEPVFDCPSLNQLEEEGLVTLQNLPSILCGQLLDPGPGDKVLDMCAAPGGKTTHLATILKVKGDEGSTLIALDKSAKRLQTLETNAIRLGLDNIQCFTFDATKALAESSSVSATINGPPFAPESFDKILLDAPCSALGQRPQYQCDMLEKEFLSFPRLQRKLIRVAVSLLKVGGTLLYSTCSPSLEENEENISWTLANFNCLRLVEAEPRLGSKGRQVQGLEAEACDKVQRFTSLTKHPEYTKDTIGFFVAVLVKINT